MATFGIVLRGDKQLQARLRSMADPKSLLKKIAYAGVQDAKALVPRRTNNLARTIRVGEVTPKGLTIKAGGTDRVGYAAFVEFGTRQHIIRPVHKKALFFPSQKATTARFGGGAILKFNLSGSLSARSTKKYGNAAYVHAKVVHHPGTQPRPYLIPGLRSALQRVGTDTIVDAWNRGA